MCKLVKGRKRHRKGVVNKNCFVPFPTWKCIRISQIVTATCMQKHKKAEWKDYSNNLCCLIIYWPTMTPPTQRESDLCVRVQPKAFEMEFFLHVLLAWKFFFVGAILLLFCDLLRFKIGFLLLFFESFLIMKIWL